MSRPMNNFIVNLSQYIYNIYKIVKQNYILYKYIRSERMEMLLRKKNIINKKKIINKLFPKRMLYGPTK